MALFADSAGRPFAGRHFQDNPDSDDDGSAPPKFLDVLRRFRSGACGIDELVAVLHGERFLVPLLAKAGSSGANEYGQIVDKTQELSVVTVSAPDGRSALPVFSSVANLSAWNAKARPVPVKMPRIALAAAKEDTPLIVLDPGSPEVLVLRHPAFRALTTGESFVPCFADAYLAKIFAQTVAGEPAVRSLTLLPGDPFARFAGAELLVSLSLIPNLGAPEWDALFVRLRENWARNETIRSRADSLTIRVSRAG